MTQGLPYSAGEIWALIIALGIGTYLIRFSFLGLIGDRPLPPLVMRLLRYTPFAVLPGLVAPMVLTGSPEAGPDVMRLIAAVATVLVGWRSGNLIAAIVTGLAVFYGPDYLSSS